MRTLPRSLVALSTMALASAGLAVGATSASAQLTTYCSGDAADVTVPGDLVVAAGDSCVLENVTVEGQTRVMAGGDLIVDGSALDDVVVNDDAYLDATDSELAGSITNRGGYGVYLERANVGGAYLGRAAGTSETFLYAYDGAFEGRLQAEQGLMHVESSQVAGHVIAENTLYADVLDSTLSRSLTVTGNAEGSAICATEVDGVATFTGNDQVQIGTGPGPLDCEGMNYFGTDVVIDDNTGAVDVTDNIIRGDLTGEGNDPAPTGSDNRVRGESGGQFADLAPAAQSLSARSASGPDHAEQLEDRRAQRRGEAADQAELAGPAQL